MRYYSSLECEMRTNKPRNHSFEEVSSWQSLQMHKCTQCAQCTLSSQDIDHLDFSLFCFGVQWWCKDIHTSCSCGLHKGTPSNNKTVKLGQFTQTLKPTHPLNFIDLGRFRPYLQCDPKLGQGCMGHEILDDCQRIGLKANCGQLLTPFIFLMSKNTTCSL